MRGPCDCKGHDSWMLCEVVKSSGGPCHAPRMPGSIYCKSHLWQDVKSFDRGAPGSDRTAQVFLDGESFAVADAEIAYERDTGALPGKTTQFLMNGELHEAKNFSFPHFRDELVLCGQRWVVDEARMTRGYDSTSDTRLDLSLILAQEKNPFTAAPKKEEKTMMEQLRTLNLDRVDLDDAIGLLTFANATKATYDTMGLSVPSWFADKVEALTAYIKQRRRENLEKAAKDIQGQIAKLKTAEEKRSDLTAELEKVKAALAQQ